MPITGWFRSRNAVGRHRDWIRRIRRTGDRPNLMTKSMVRCRRTRIDERRTAGAVFRRGATRSPWREMCNGIPMSNGIIAVREAGLRTMCWMPPRDRIAPAPPPCTRGITEPLTCSEPMHRGQCRSRQTSVRDPGSGHAAQEHADPRVSSGRPIHAPHRSAQRARPHACRAKPNRAAPCARPARSCMRAKSAVSTHARWLRNFCSNDTRLSQIARVQRWRCRARARCGAGASHLVAATTPPTPCSSANGRRMQAPVPCFRQGYMAHLAGSRPAWRRRRVRADRLTSP